MTNVHKLGTVPVPRVEERRRLESIKLLEDALAQAKDGKVSEALVILQHPDGGHTTLLARTENTTGWIGYLEWLKFHWLRNQAEESDLLDEEDDDQED